MPHPQALANHTQNRKSQSPVINYELDYRSCRKKVIFMSYLHLLRLNKPNAVKHTGDTQICLLQTKK